MDRVQIVGSGIAGLSAAITLAKKNIACDLISVHSSERAQSALAEGGINAALNTMGEDDSPEQHMEDTLRSGAGLSDPEAVRGLTDHAPEIIRALDKLGVPFAHINSEIRLRRLGGHRKKRTAYAKSSTGKMILTALIDEARKYETNGSLICRYPHHRFLRLILDESGEKCEGIVISDEYTGDVMELYGPVILACGGLNGLFPGATTGTYDNSAEAAASVFAQGVRFGNLEMIQYHPTTTGISGKCMLISEAARGEGGRIYIDRGGKPWYFMEEKYPELGNLMPRDIVSRESFFALADPECGNQIYLDMRGISEEAWKENISDLMDEIIHFKKMDPKTEPIPVETGIHYFMGGIDVDVRHRTNIENLYAAGECCDQYHGANRLGGNSTLGAIYGGGVAATQLSLDIEISSISDNSLSGSLSAGCREPAEGSDNAGGAVFGNLKCPESYQQASPENILRIRDILLAAMGIVRNEKGLMEGLDALEAMERDDTLNRAEVERINLAKAMVLSALLRRESRGSHYREDYPESDPDQQKRTLAYGKDSVNVSYEER